MDMVWILLKKSSDPRDVVLAVCRSEDDARLRRDRIFEVTGTDADIVRFKIFDPNA